jgi:alkaline phosphatase D
MLPAMPRLAIASCCKLWQDPSHHAWSGLVAERPRPDWLLLLGDNIYLRKRHERALKAGRVSARAVLEPEYARLVSEPSFQALVGPPGGGSDTRLLATWDDHDFGGDDVNGADLPHRAYREESRKVFLEYLAGAGGPRSEVYCALSPLPDVRIIVTDCRYYRTDASSPGATLLGATQEAWLLEELARPEALKIIASGSCVGPRAKKRYKQGWDLYPNWLDRFREAVVRRHAAGKRHLFVSGDIHRNRLIDHSHSSAGFPLIEVISSGACRRKTDWNPWSLPLQNYGVLDVSDASIEIRLTGNRARDRQTAIVDMGAWSLEGS